VHTSEILCSQKFFYKKLIKNAVFISSSYEGVMTEDEKRLSESAGKCTKTDRLNLYDSPNFSVRKSFFKKR